jgi:hypothetical protein
MSDPLTLQECNKLEAWLETIKPEDAAVARDIWNMFAALMDGQTMSAEYAAPLLKRTKGLLTRMGDTVTAKYVEWVRLKEGDAQASEWDNIRNLLHLIFEPKSGGGWSWAEIRRGKYKDNRGRV